MYRFVVCFLLVAPVIPRAQPATARDCDASQVAALSKEARDSFAQHQYNTAAQRFQFALAACPSNRSLQLELAQAYFMAQRLSDARTQADNILRLDPGNPAAIKIRANADYLQGDFEHAKALLIQHMDRHPDDADAPYMLGRMYYQEGFVDHAMGQFQRVLKMNPSAYKAWDNLGLCYQALGDTDAATRHFLTAIKLVEKDHPDYDWAYANLSELLFKTGDAEKAYAAASIAANRNPLSARNFYLGGKALDKLGKTELALNWLQRSAALDPKYPEPHYLLARIYKRLGETDKAEQASQEFSKLKAAEPSKKR